MIVDGLVRPLLTSTLDDAESSGPAKTKHSRHGS